MKKEKHVGTHMVLYNVAFFGGQREGAVDPIIDGQLEVWVSKTHFCAKRIGGYGNLVSFPKENTPITELSDNSYRFLHDWITWHKQHNHVNIQVVEFPEGCKVFKYHDNTYIGANVQLGDMVQEITDTNQVKETFMVLGRHDIGHINQNFFYRITGRTVPPHPDKATKKDFISALNARTSNAKVFSRWERTEMPKVKNMHSLGKFSIQHEGTVLREIEGWSDCENSKNMYYVKVIEKGFVTYYKKWSSISAPYYDLIEELCGKVFAKYDDGRLIKYSVYDVVTTKEFEHWDKFTAEESYHFNNALTKF